MDSRIYEFRKQAKAMGEPVLRDKSFELLLKTVEENKPKKILEVGTNLGYSGIAMLLKSPCSTLTGIEIDEDKVKKAKENYKLFNVETRAKIFWGDASEVIPRLTGKYDFIFLDGPKGHYYEYLDNLLSALNVNGILFADNVLFHGIVYSKEKTPKKLSTIKHSMENFLEKITGDKNLLTTVYQMEDGVSITKKLYE